MKVRPLRKFNTFKKLSYVAEEYNDSCLILDGTYVIWKHNLSTTLNSDKNDFEIIYKDLDKGDIDLIRNIKMQYGIMKYGEFKPLEDERDLIDEAIQELIDFINYLEMHIQKNEKDISVIREMIKSTNEKIIKLSRLNKEN
jgi:ribosomal protein S15P/S13E